MPEPSPGFGRATQSDIYRAGATGTRPVIPSSWDALEAAAKKAMSAKAWAYVAGSSGAEATARANHAAFDRWRIVPRVLRDVSRRDLGITLFGRRHPSPVIASPVGVLELAHPDADLAVARATAALGVPYILSTQASTPMEDTAAAMSGGSHWFQLYWSSSDALVESMIARAETSGAEAIVITLDTHMLGWRPRDLDAAFLPFIHGQGIAQYTSDPVFRAIVRERMAAAAPTTKPRVTAAAVRTLLDMTRNYPGSFLANLRSGEPRVAVETFLDLFAKPSLTWADLAFVRERTSLPILLKGIQHPDDVISALNAGMDGVIVSNHAGRQIDGAVASLDALPAVVDAVDGRVPVLFDSGVRSGTDVFTALALGAAAVCVGRPYVYGLAIAGEAGAQAALRNIVAEFDITLGLAGYTSVTQLGRDALVPELRS